MKLTKTLREAFVSAAMNDVPSIDYDEQIQKLGTEAALAAMPPEVLTAYKKHPEYFDPNGFSITKDAGWHYVYVPAHSSFKFPEETRKKADELKKLGQAQSRARNELRQKLEGVVNSVTTRKALAEALPEFTKYLPEELTKTSMLPAIANTVAEFVQAGWPKNKAVA
jgi:hypothetical protein